jgi:hypothetical protein
LVGVEACRSVAWVFAPDGSRAEEADVSLLQASKIE